MLKSASPEEIKRRVTFTDKAYELGIDLYAYDEAKTNASDEEVYKHNIDVNTALLLLQQGKNIPKDLEERLLDYKNRYLK